MTARCTSGFRSAARTATLESINDDPDHTALLVGIDVAIQSHLGWNQRLLRCGLLREPPGDDLLLPDSHRRCKLGGWMDRERAALAKIAPALVEQITETHEIMHDAVRSMCVNVLGGAAAASTDLERFEECQTRMIALFGHLRDRITDATAHRDHLTGLPLRQELSYAFELRQRDAGRDCVGLYLAMIDVDRFKAINDTFGHLVGDAALRFIAGQLRATLRASDILFRYGGEEFLALLLVADSSGAELAAQRLRQTVRATPMKEGGHEVPLSVTIGLTRVADAEALSAAIERADQALFEGKRAGRDRVVLR